MAFLAFLAFEIKNMAMAEFWGLNGPKKPKKLTIFDYSSNPDNFFGFLGPFGPQNSAIAIFLISKARKAKKATKRPKIANLGCGKVLGPSVVSQGPMQSHKVI